MLRRVLGGESGGLQCFLNAGEQSWIFGQGFAGEAPDDIAMAVHQVFVKVPARAIATESFEFFKQRAGSTPGDAAFREHWKLHAVCVEAEVSNLRVASWLLLAEIVGREAQYDQAPGLVAGINTFQTLVLGCESAVTGGVYDQCYFSAELT